jgi:SAM-dependent methyltransferase
MSARAGGLVGDEFTLMQEKLPLEGARIVDLGCGNAQMSRRMLSEGRAASVAALEVDRAQHAKNLVAAPLPGLSLVLAGADDIPFPEGAFDVATMFKSLHHVPLDRLDRSLLEIRRVLAPGGLLYVSEPVFAGPFNEIVRLFHDEELVRAAAQAALARAAAAGVFERVEEIRFDAPLAFRNFDDFFQRVVRVTHSDLTLVGEKLEEVRRRFEAHMGMEGAKFVRPMRVAVMRSRPGRA